MGEAINRVEKIRFQVDDEVSDGAPNVNSKLKVSVCAVTGGNDGAVLWTHVAAICQEFEQGRRYRGGREPVVDDQGRSAGSAPGAASVCASSTGTLR